MIHAVGPVWHGGERGEHELLASCYRRSLELAAAHRARSIAFPCISTGAYGYPFESAAQIAVATTRAVTRDSPAIEEVVFCCFSAGDFAVYESLLAAGDPYPTD